MNPTLNRSFIRIREALRLNRAWVMLGLTLGFLGQAMPASGAETKSSTDTITITNSAIIVHPIHHATLVMVSRDAIIYIDPVGGRQRFVGLPRPDLILITDLHEDHLSTDTLESVVAEKSLIIAPSAVAEKLPENLRKQTKILANGETHTLAGITIEAVPMYNVTEDRLQYHSKGRGNGYVVTANDKRVYISGDTEDIPEMRGLKNIDAAFVCMNLPFTMTVEQAASAVREFKPKIVCPYHCQGSDLEKFKKLVSDDAGVTVQLRNWYK